MKKTIKILFSLSIAIILLCTQFSSTFIVANAASYPIDNVPTNTYKYPVIDCYNGYLEDKTWNGDVVDIYRSVKDRLFLSLGKVIDTTEAGYIEFDVFATAPMNDLTLWICNMYDGSGRIAFNVPFSQNKVGAWNHYVLDFADAIGINGIFDRTKWINAYFTGDPNDPGVIVRFKIANLGASKYITEPVREYNNVPQPSYIHSVVKTYDVDLNGSISNTVDKRFFTQSEYQTAFENLSADPFDITTAEYVEFDLYSDFPANILCFSLGSTSITPNETDGSFSDFYDVRSEMCIFSNIKRGWNHVVMPMGGNLKNQDTATKNSGTYNPKAVTGLVFNLVAATYLRLTNLAFTNTHIETPTIKIIEGNKVTLSPIEGYEYSIGGEEWQSSNIFANVPFDTTLNFYQRIANSEKITKSKALKIFVVSTPKVLLGKTSLRVEFKENFEYCIQGISYQDTTWQDSNEFINLNPNSYYIVYGRPKNIEDVYFHITGTLINTNGKDEIINPTANDFVLLKQILFSEEECNELAADFNKDSVVNLLDLISLKNNLLNN